MTTLQMTDETLSFARHTHRSCRKRARGSPGPLRMTKVKGKICLTLSQLGKISCEQLLSAPVFSEPLLLSPTVCSTSPVQLRLVLALTLTMCMGWIPYAPHSSTLPTATHRPGQPAYGNLTVNIHSPVLGTQDFQKCSGTCSSAHWGSVEQMQRPLCYNTCRAVAPLPLPTVWGHRVKELVVAQSHSQGQSISLVPGSKRALYVGQPQQS